MSRSTLWRWIFSLKTFAAAMLALYVAFATGMERPMWSLVTVYVVSQPLSGAIRSKAAYRFIGTLCGAAAAVALSAMFVSSPLLLTAVLVVWICGCAYLAALDRTPRGYLFLLAGLTAVIVALPGVGDPANVFQAATFRSLEIGLGITSVLVVDSIFFPSSVVPVLGAEVAAWLQSAETWMIDALSDDPARRAASAADRRRLAADAARLDVLAVHLRFETATELRPAAGLVSVLRERALMLLPTLSAIEDNARELARDGVVLPAQLGAFRDAFHAWVEAGSPPEGAAAVKDQLRAPVLDADSLLPDAAWDAILAAGLRRVLARLVDLWSDCRILQRRLASGDEVLPAHLERALATTRPAMHRDRGMALWNSVGAAISFAAVAAFWNATQWSYGGAAALYALMMPLFLGSMDDPTPALAGLAKILIGASVFAGVYMYAILPAVHTFPTLVLALAGAFVPLGFLLANPARMMIAIQPIAMLSFDNGTIGDFTTYANGAVAGVVGVIGAMAIIALVRAIGAEAGAHRILRAGWAELAELAELASAPREADLRAFTTRMLDRLGLLVPRLAAVDEGHEITSADALTDLRTGLHLVVLEEHRAALLHDADRAVGDVLAGVAAHFTASSALRRGVIAAPAALLALIDAALVASIEQALRGDAERVRPAISALAGIRRGLYPQAKPFRTPSSPLPMGAAA